MSGLGISQTKKFTKLQLAEIQLASAIELFIKKQFVPAITLAGAAEEILAGMLKVKGDSPTIEKSYELIEKIREHTQVTVYQGKSKKEIFKEWNRVRNRLKHHDKNEDDVLEFNDCDEAYYLIKRALLNAKELAVTISNEYLFENWVIEHACL